MCKGVSKARQCCSDQGKGGAGQKEKPGSSYEWEEGLSGGSLEKKR